MHTRCCRPPRMRRGGAAACSGPACARAHHTPRVLTNPLRAQLFGRRSQGALCGVSAEPQRRRVARRHRALAARGRALRCAAAAQTLLRIARERRCTHASVQAIASAARAAGRRATGGTPTPSSSTRAHPRSLTRTPHAVWRCASHVSLCAVVNSQVCAARCGPRCVRGQGVPARPRPLHWHLRLCVSAGAC
jgi:hypothetical protein